GWNNTQLTYTDVSDLYSSLQTPAGHNPITFVNAIGSDPTDIGYPTSSPNVVAVGGTDLTVNGDGNWYSEVGWSESGGGVSNEALPTYQTGIEYYPSVSASNRVTPDVALAASEDDAVPIYDSFNSGW